MRHGAIHSDQEAERTRDWMHKFRMAAETIAAASPAGIDPVLCQAMVDSYHSLAEEMRAALVEYEKEKAR